MKVFVANSSKQAIGGGWTFLDNIRKALPDLFPSENNYPSSDVFFIPSASMIDRAAVKDAKIAGKKIVLRVDNVLRNSRNRNTGMTRMKDFADMADLVIYQSQWTKKYLGPFLGKIGPVILNGVDLNLYNGNRVKHDKAIFLYSRYNRDETKNWEAARYWFSRRIQAGLHGQLWIVGNYSPELIEGNFDFYAGEDYRFLGAVPPDQMPNIYAQADWLLYTFFNDACSNTLIEALVSGCQVNGDHYYRRTGGAAEILRRFDRFGRDYFGLERMGREYREALERL